MIVGFCVMAVKAEKRVWGIFAGIATNHLESRIRHVLTYANSDRWRSHLRDRLSLSQRQKALQKVRERQA